jgi:hypothetical protein
MLTKHLPGSRLWIDSESTPYDPGVDPGSTLKIRIVAQPGFLTQRNHHQNSIEYRLEGSSADTLYHGKYTSYPQ